MQEERQEPDGEFKPNLINTICFLANFAIQVGWGGACAGCRWTRGRRLLAVFVQLGWAATRSLAQLFSPGQLRTWRPPATAQARLPLSACRSA